MNEVIDYLVIFDLDGTLIRENSHLKVLNDYLPTGYRILYKVWAKIFPSSFQNLIDKKILEIPIDFISKEVFSYRRCFLDCIRDMKREGKRVIVVSNSPSVILCEISKQIGINCYHAPIKHKAEFVINNFKYNFLEIFTDSESDIDLIKLADKANIIGIKPKFKKYCLQNARFISEEKLQ